MKQMFFRLAAAFAAMVATSASAGGIVDKVAMWGYVLDKTPTTCPFMFGRTDFSLERAAEEFGVRKAMYMNSCFNQAYIAKNFDYWGAECVANCISNRLTDLQLDKLRGMDEVWCAATHGQKFESSIAIAKMSLKYPNIVGINFDDFNPNNAELGMDVVSFRALKAAVRSINPKLKFSVVSYAKDSNGTNFDLSPFRGEIDHVSRWKWVTDADYWKRLREEIAELRRQVGPGVEIVHGLYLHDFAKGMKCLDPLPLDYFKLSVSAALDAVADGTLDGVILPQVAWYSAPSHREHYEWLREKIRSMRSYDLHTRALTPIAEKPAPSGKPLRLVEAGEVKFPIVTDDAKRDADAVALLREVFEKTTGRAPEVLSLSAAAGRSPRIVLAADAALPKEGFSIRTSEGALTISGHTYYGALDFAERFLGVRWFFPGENGAIYPPCRDLVVSPVWYEDAPWFQSRGNLYALSKSFRGKAQEEKWAPYMGAVAWKNISGFAKRWRNGGSLPGGGSHNPRPEMIAQAHPDKLKTIFYTSPNGKFWYNPKAHLGNYYNVLDLGFADLLVDDWKRYIASGYSKAEDRGGFRGQINDTFVTFGVCDTSMPLGEVVSHPLVKELNLITEADLKREKYSAMAGIYARFFQYLGRKVEQELPGRRLFLLCYYNAKCASLDPRWKLPSNVEVNLCDERFPLRMRAPKLVEEMRERYREWYDALGGRPVLKAWLYSGVTPFGRAVGPEFVGEVPKALGKYMGRGGLFYDFTGSQDLWHYYYSAYVAWRSQWNPELDVDAAIDEMWDLCLGAKAGAKMKDFHRELKAAFVKYQGADGADVADPSYPTAVIDRLESLLAEAEALIAPGSVEMKRFRLVADFWPEAFRQQRAKASYRPPVYGVRRLASGEAPAVDGSPDDPVWEKAPVLPLMNRFSGDSVAYGGEVRLLWDDRGVYAAFKSRDGAPRTDGSMWDNDTIEFYFSHGLGKEVLNLIAFDAAGSETTQRQRLLPIPQPKDLEWKAPGHVYRAKTSADGWTAELFVPFSAFEEAAPRAGDEWNFNFAWTGRATKPAKSASYSLTGAAHKNLPMYGIVRFL